MLIKNDKINIALKHLRQWKLLKHEYDIPFGWNIFETNFTIGGLLGYSSVNSIVNRNVPKNKRYHWLGIVENRPKNNYNNKQWINYTAAKIS